MASDTQGSPALTLDAGIPATPLESDTRPAAEPTGPAEQEPHFEQGLLFERTPPVDQASPFDQAPPFEQALPAEQALAASGEARETAVASPDMRLEFDDRTAVMMQRLNIWKDELVAWFKTLASAAVYATLIVTFGFQVARVEGQSMAPTLADQDRLIVNKLAYRIGEPRRGDIVMLYYPLNPDKSFVKRVIAEEGDQVRIVDGRVFRNDVPLDDSFVPSEYRSHDDWGPQVIPEGYYFVMGDHRNNSSDSRHWGYVPKKYVIGKVQLRWWPLPEARLF
jgi:signal peptidase I